MSFEINEAKVSDWMTKWKSSFGPIAEDPTSLKTLIYLTLLERGNELTSYQDIAEELKRREVVKGEMDDFVPLRNGMNQIVNALKTHSLYEIENRKNGRASSYRLKSRTHSTASNNGTGGAKTGKIVKMLDDPELTATTDFEYVVKKLAIDRVMPFYGIYLPMTAASRWVLYSEAEVKGRGKYEADECLRLLDDWLSGYSGEEISIIGLGVGEGIGEIEIIERLLDKKPKQEGERTFNFSRIHYCAIDTNVHLLMDHVERLKHKFRDEIESGRLLCGVACGNFLEDFTRIVKRLREEFVAVGPLDSGQEFLPDTGTLVSILGNVVGNAERAKEWSYFEPVRNTLSGYDLAFLLGVSVRQPASKQENYEGLNELLLATPRYLTHELLMLETGQGETDAEKQEAPEFDLPADKEERDKRWPGARRAEYQGAGTELIKGAQVTGEIYEFYYITRWDLSVKSDGKEETIRQGSPLLLHNIIKFDKDTLVKFLESKGLYSSLEKSAPDDIESGKQNRRYVIIAMTSRPPA
jgi:hypothetical protein